ncbi:MAG: hypothetical protein RLZZ511_4354, partial [Cyanobacteriota bacterium]
MKYLSWSLGLLLVTGGAWVGQLAIQPPIAQAYKNRTDVRLARLKDETYQSMIRRAEIVARAAAQRSFDRDILMSEVSIMVIGEYQGAEAPLLMLEVSRQNWRQRPDTRRWATYYRTAKQLLKLPSAPDPARPNAAPGQSAPFVPEVAPVEQPIAAPQTVPGVSEPTGAAPRPGTRAVRGTDRAATHPWVAAPRADRRASPSRPPAPPAQSPRPARRS